MKNELAVIDGELANQGNDRMPITRQDLDLLSDKRVLLKEFVSKQLVQGDDSDGDFAIIAGCKKPSLLKPGAEKLMQLFGLGSRLTLTFKEIDHNGNFAMFVYKCEIFNLRTGITITECEGSANSKEKKWATKTEWVKRNNVSEKKQVEASIYDNLNTLMKMAQKRAEVGAVVKATGASDFFTHDMENEQDAEDAGVKAKVTTEAPKTSTPGQMTLKGNTHPHKDLIKQFGGRWDLNAKAWVIQNPSDEARKELSALEGVEIS